MRVGILTLHLHTNVGGILQAAALYRFLADHGFDPVLLRKEPETQGRAGRLLRDLLRRLPLQNLGGVRERHMARARHHSFIRRFMPKRTRPCHNAHELREEAERWGLEAVVVGSDQVWRQEYHQDLNSHVYFLDFVPGHMRKLSYAASFGHSEWQYPEQRTTVTKLLGQFDAVSVREKSGIGILSSALDREQCELVLDPTLIVDPRLYAEAAAPPDEDDSPALVSYVLDPSPATERATADALEALPGPARTVQLSASEAGEGASTGQWLRAFMNADYVVTDSYHGTLFSILFGKQFVVFGNRKRGLDRFTTILDALELRDRLLIDDGAADIRPLLDRRIDYPAVHRRLDRLRQSSREFLLRSLTNGGGQPALAPA